MSKCVKVTLQQQNTGIVMLLNVFVMNVHFNFRDISLDLKLTNRK